MRPNQGSKEDLLGRYANSNKMIDLLTINSPNAWKDTTMQQNNSGVVSREKYNQLKNLNQKLKSTLREYIEQSKDYEKQLIQKEELIVKYENERLDIKSRNSEEFKSQINDLKTKLQKKKTKIRLLKDSTKTVDHRLDEQKATFQVELERVQRMYETLTNEIKDHEKRYQLLKDENNVLKQALSSREDQCRYFEMGAQDDKQNIILLDSRIKELIEEKKILQLALDNQVKKTDELEKQAKISEQLFQQDLSKSEQDKSQLQNEYLTQINKKKEKSKALLLQIQQLEQQLQQQQKEELSLNKVIQEQKQDFIKLQSQLDDQRNKTDLALKEANYKVQEVKDLKCKIDSQKALLQSYEDKLAQYDIQYQIDQTDKQQIFLDIDKLHAENRNLSHIIYESDKDIEYLKQQHEEELAHIEKKVETLINQLSSAKEEISEQKKMTSELKKQLVQSEEQGNAYKNKYLKVKQNQKTIQSEQKYLEEKVKLMESERIFEEKEALKTKDYVIQQRQVQQSKIKVLDEIQNMIKQHKKLTN